MPSSDAATSLRDIPFLKPEDLPHRYDHEDGVRCRVATTTIDGVVLYAVLEAQSEVTVTEKASLYDGDELSSTATADCAPPRAPSSPQAQGTPLRTGDTLEEFVAAFSCPVHHLVVQFTPDAEEIDPRKTFLDSVLLLNPANLTVVLAVARWPSIQSCFVGVPPILPQYSLALTSHFVPFRDQESLPSRATHLRLCKLLIVFLDVEVYSNKDGMGVQETLTSFTHNAFRNRAPVAALITRLSDLKVRAATQAGVTHLVNTSRTPSEGARSSLLFAAAFVDTASKFEEAETQDCLDEEMIDSTGPVLNYDILIMVTRLLAQPSFYIADASAMSRTCRHLHLECDPLLLSPRHIVVRGSIRIESFCRYILSDVDRRVPRLSQLPVLEFGGHPLSESVVDLLVEMLEHITSLQCLRLDLFEEFMSSSPRLFQAFAAFRGTDCLDIELYHFPGKWYYASFLKATKAPLTYVGLSLRDYDTKKNMRYVAYCRNLDPLWLFRAHSSTLEHIALHGRFTAEACSVIRVYPRLTHFTIHHRSVPLVRPYIQAFPFLRVLRFDLEPYAWATLFMPTEDVQEATLRKKRAEDLRRQNREDQLVYGSWPALEYFMGMTLDAYIAGLACRIHTLHLVAWGGSMEGEVSAICTIFADARPSTFRLALRPQHVDYIPSLFVHRLWLFSSLTSLELRLDLTEAPFDFGTYFDDVGIALQQLSIISLQVEIKCWAHYATTKPNERVRMYCDDPHEPRKSGDIGCYTLDALSHEDMDGRLRYFLDKIRTLRRITIAWGQCRVNIPHRFITVDLDSIPHTADRPGQATDDYWQEGYRLWRCDHGWI